MSEELADDQPDYSDGVMLCIRPEDPGRFTIEGGTPPDDMHLTLMYFGKTDTFDAAAAEQVKGVMGELISPNFAPLHGEVTGVTLFKEGDPDKGRPLVLLVDAPGLTELRSKVWHSSKEVLSSDQQPSESHDFMPHMTMVYGVDDTGIEYADSLVGEALEFNFIELVWGTESTVWPLEGRNDEAAITESGVEAGLPLSSEHLDSRPESNANKAKEADMATEERSDDPLAIVIDGEFDDASREERMAAIESFLNGEDEEFAPQKGVNPFPPKKKEDDEEDEDDEGEAPKPADEGEAPKPTDDKAPVPPVKKAAPPAPEEKPDAEAPEKKAVAPVAPEKKAVPSEGAKPAPAVAEKPVDGEDDEEDDEDDEEEKKAAAGEEPEGFKAIAVHDTPTAPGSWDGPANEERAKSGESADYYRAIYAWADPEGDPDVKASYKFIHHEVEEDGTPGAASLAACSAGIAVLNGGRGGTTIPEADRQGVYEHLAHHLRSADKEAPELASAEDAAAFAVNASATFAAVPVHHTATTDSKDFDGDAVKVNSRSGESPAYYDKIYAWRDSSKDPSHKTAYRFPHHLVSAAGEPGAAVDWACHASLMFIEDSTIPRSDYQGVYNHLAAHLKDADMEVPDLGSDNASIDEIKSAIASVRAEFYGRKNIEVSDVKQPQLSEMDDVTLMGEFMRRWVESVASKGTEFAPEGGSPAPTEPGPGKGMDQPDDEDEKEVRPQVGGTSTYEWEGVLIPEGVPSGDGRMIEEGSLTWRDLPLPLMLQTVNAEGHSGAVICGSIHEIERVGNNIVGRGNFDSGTDGEYARRLLEEGTMRGVSADIDSVVMDLRDENGNEVSMEDAMFGGAAAMEVLVQGRIMGATMTPFPAFQEASIHVLTIDEQAEDEVLVASGSERAGEVWRVGSPYPLVLNGVHEPIEFIETVVASGAIIEELVIPVSPPQDWFSLPEMDEPMPFTVYPDGRCYGLVAQFGICHIGRHDRCVDVPRSTSGYRFFRNKSVLTAEGNLIATGPVFMDTVHPSLRMKAHDAEAHYADTGCAVADVALYENEFGIVAAGAVRSDATPEQIRRLRGSDISPDWRSIDGRLEVVGLLSVNVSGFPVPGLVASGGEEIPMETAVARGRFNTVTGEVEALVAAGSMRRCTTCGNQGSLGHHDMLAIAESIAQVRAELSELRDAVRPYRMERLATQVVRLASLVGKEDTEVEEVEQGS